MLFPVRRSVMEHKAPNRLCLNVKIDPDRLSFNIEIEEHSLGDLYKPANYKTALSYPEFEKWLVAMDRGMLSMNVNKGFTQTYGVDYEETFSPVADIRAIRILIAIAAYYDYEIWQMDVKTVFLNGFLEEEIYMEQPEGFIDPNYNSNEMRYLQNVPYAWRV
ncbi:retrotransposon protein, putative, ty1-copia subclass [Tanacetum coccineum]